MDPAHRRKAIAARERPAQSRVDLRLVGPLMCDEVFRDDAVCFADQFHALRRFGRVESANDVAQPIEARFELHMLLA